MSGENFFDCIESVVDNQRILEETLKQLPILAKANDRKSFAAAIDDISAALTALQGRLNWSASFNHNNLIYLAPVKKVLALVCKLNSIIGKNIIILENPRFYGQNFIK